MRLRDWEVRLQAVIAEWQAAEFQYGTYDCALFASAAVLAMTEFDLSAGLRDYTTEAEGLALVKAQGYADHVDVFAQNLLPAARLKRGDIAIVRRDGLVALGVCQGRGIYIMTPDRGLALVPNSWASEGFSV